MRPDTDVSGAIARSLRTWSKVANVRFSEISSEKVSVSPPARQGDGVSLITVAQTPENLLLFSGDSTDISARTRVFYDNKGFITEADIVLNPYQQFSTDGSIGTFDLEATITHEIGHLLGLDHSFVIGAAMYVNHGFNGVYGLSSFSSRTLSDDDIVRVRAIYGSPFQTEICCGLITGDLKDENEEPLVGAKIWFENMNDGRVVASTITDQKGRYSVDGLADGDYFAFAKTPSDDGDLKKVFSVQPLGTIELRNKRTAVLDAHLSKNQLDFELDYIGFNGQLSRLAVPINGGRSYIIYVGGKNLDLNEQTIVFSSALIKLNSKSVVTHQYRGDLSVQSFEITVDEKIGKGNYSLGVSNNRGEMDVLIGCLTIGEFENHSNSYLGLSEN